MSENIDVASPSRPANYLDLAWRTPSGRARFAGWVAVAMLIITIVGGLVVLPITAVLPDGEIGTMLTNLLPFVGSIVLLIVGARLIMRRPLWTFAAPDTSPRWGLFARAVVIQVVCLGLSTLVFALSPVGSLEVTEPDWGVFAAVVPIALVGFAIQTLAEEIVFRGIWPQGVWRFTPHLVVVYGLPALVFASIHIGNSTALGNGAVALLPYFAMAAFLGWVSYRTGSLWTSWGLHFGNNVYLVLLIGSHDDVTTPVSGLAFVYSHPDAEGIITTTLTGLALSVAVTWFVVLRHAPRTVLAPRDEQDEPTS